MFVGHQYGKDCLHLGGDRRFCVSTNFCHFQHRLYARLFQSIIWSYK